MIKKISGENYFTQTIYMKLLDSKEDNGKKFIMNNTIKMHCK